MKTLPYFFILLLLIITSLHGEIHHLKLPSEALGDSNRVIVATPDAFNADARKRYPFIMMLHGWSGDETQWKDDSDLQALANQHDILLILPDGGYDGWWVDNIHRHGRNYETHLLHEIKRWTIKTFKGSRKSDQHGVMGLSMGGYGSMLQVLKHPKKYAAAASLSGVLDITVHTDNWKIASALGPYSENQSHWEANNPYHLAQDPPHRLAPDMIIICGRDDFAFEENVAISERLKANAYPVTFKPAPGTHSHDFWKTHVTEAIAFIVAHMDR